MYWFTIQKECTVFIIFTLESNFNTDFGDIVKSVLQQNSVIMRVLYTGSIGSGSQASTVL